MIISCNNCHKKFHIDASLIPEKGRLVQCNSCNHKWFFKKEIFKEPVSPVKIIKTIEEIKPFKEESVNTKGENPEKIELLDEEIQENLVEDNVKNVNIHPKKNSSKSYNIFALTLVFIMSFIALIIVLDTFQGPIGKIAPNIEFLLYNLYESINDIRLFFKDLI